MCASVVLGTCMTHLDTKQGNTQSYDFGQHALACKEKEIKHASAVGKATIFHCQQERPETIRKGAQAVEAMQREFKTIDNMKMVVEAWGGGCISLSARLHAISRECTCSSEEEKIWQMASEHSPQGKASETDATSSAETRIRGSEGVYAEKFGSKRQNS